MTVAHHLLDFAASEAFQNITAGIMDSERALVGGALYLVDKVGFLSRELGQFPRTTSHIRFTRYRANVL